MFDMSTNKRTRCVSQWQSQGWAWPGTYPANPHMLMCAQFFYAKDVRGACITI